eukprot:m.85839 g.85839  ORF g.85839 m.85839 type:complete len:337 (+) comp36479_c0_seq1:193-1203(+)
MQPQPLFTALLFLGTATTLIFVVFTYMEPSKFSNPEHQGIQTFSGEKLKPQVNAGVINVSQTTAGPSGRLPDAIIIGAKKAGTRSLLSMLQMHPQIRCFGKESHFFDNKKIFARGLDYYRRLMPPGSEGEVVLEKTPNYLPSPLAPKLIQQFLPPSTKFIAIFRDPIDRAMSDFTQTFVKNQHVKSFRRKVFSPCDNGKRLCVATNASIVRISRYADHVKHWLEYFDKSRFLFLDGSRLVQNPVAVLRQVASFLGVEAYYTDDMFYFNKERGFYCRVNWGETDGCLGATKGRNHVKLDSLALKKLQNYFRPFNSQLSKLTGITFGWNDAYTLTSDQ